MTALADRSTRRRAADAASSSCAHCGQMVRPLDRDELDAIAAQTIDDQPFCCRGCASVYRLLHAHGADRFYTLRDRPLDPARPSGAAYAHYDEPTFELRHVTAQPDGARTVDLFLEGVRCAACVWLVERLPRLSPGIVSARLDLGRSRARIAWDPAVTSLGAIARTLDSFGYRSHPYRDTTADVRSREDRDYLIRLGVVGASAGNVMLVAFALYGGYLDGMAAAHETFFRWASLLASLPALIWGGGVFFVGARAALRARTLHMDLPIALGIAGAFGASAVHTAVGRGEVYFDSVTALIFLLLAGRWLQRRHQRRATAATELAQALTPAFARRVTTDGTQDVPVEALVVGDEIEVRAGETIAADGRIVVGTSEIDRALLTGEARPESVSPGEVVNAGTVNIRSPLRVIVESVGEDTRVGGLMRLVEAGASARSEIVAMADRISGWFVAAVLSIAASTIGVWLAIDPARAIPNAIAVLVVTCPCALGLATPLAVAAAVGRAAKGGLLVKTADVFERLALPGRVWLDKTGTVTERTMRIVRWTGSDSALRLAAALERSVAHPIAEAFRSVDGADTLPVGDVVHAVSGGVAGVVGGRRVRIGATHWIGDVTEIDARTAATVAESARAGHTPLVVTIDDAIAGVVSLGDPIRGDAQDAIERLRAAGWTVGILSGDHAELVRGVGAQLGVAPGDAIGGQSPEEKLARIERDRAAGTVIMVGDGVNDAAALAAATVGVAVRGGAEVSLDAADVFLTRPGLVGVAQLVEGSARTRAVIRRNLVFSLAYNAIGVTLCVAGWVNPLVAAVLMPVSSLTVITSSYRATTFRAEDSRCR